MPTTSTNDRVTNAITLWLAGQVRRCHTFEYLGHYDVAQHTYGVIAILRSIYPAGELFRSHPNLAEAALLHDSAEHMVGDMPAPIKKGELGTMVQKTEVRHMRKMGLEFPPLTPQERLDLLAADKMELLLWGYRQRQWGNQCPVVKTIISGCEKWFPHPPNCPPGTKMNPGFLKLLQLAATANQKQEDELPPEVANRGAA